MARFLKKIVVCISALLVASAAISEAAAKTVAKTMKVGAFHAIDVAGSIDVTYTKGSGPMRIKGPEQMVSRLKTKIEKGVLKLELSHNSWGVFKGQDNCGKVRISVSSASLDEVEVSSGGVVDVKSAINSADMFDVEASSGGVVNVGSVTAPKCDIDISSGAVVNILSVNVGKISVDSSSGAVLNVQKVSATTVDADMSGGCVTEMSGNCGTLIVDVSGGAVGSLKGLKAKTARVEASGGAVLDYSAAKASVDKDISSIVNNHR